MNSYFINIEFDREERPDVDAVYMKAVQLMTGRGGWPINIVADFLTENQYGVELILKNDWINSLEKLQDL